MAIFSDINPNVTSGNQLATILNSFKNSYRTGNIGSTRDPNLAAGGIWIDSSVPNILKFNLYDGTVDNEIFRLDITTGIVSFPGGGDSFTLARETDDSIGPILEFIKRRASGSKQTQDGDILAHIDFKSFSDTSTEEITSQIEVVSEDAATSTVHGSSIRFKSTIEGAGTLVERMRISKTGFVGILQASPDELLHIGGNYKASISTDDAIGRKVILQKSRLANSGQVLTNDVLGEYEFYANDNAGNKYSAATIRAVATENHTVSNRGTKIVIESIKTGGVAKSVGIEIDGDQVSIAGQSLNNDLKTTSALLDSTITRNLATINGALWKSFFMEVNFWGRSDIPEQRAQFFKITGQYNANLSIWYYKFDSDILTDTENLIDLNFTNGSSLVIDYLNKIPNLNFIEGRIDMELRRIA